MTTLETDNQISGEFSTRVFHEPEPALVDHAANLGGLLQRIGDTQSKIAMAEVSIGSLRSELAAIQADARASLGSVASLIGVVEPKAKRTRRPRATATVTPSANGNLLRDKISAAMKPGEILTVAQIHERLPDYSAGGIGTTLYANPERFYKVSSGKFRRKG